MVVLVRAVRGSDRRGWTLEARLGIVDGRGAAPRDEGRAQPPARALGSAGRARVEPHRDRGRVRGHRRVRSPARPRAGGDASPRDGRGPASAWASVLVVVLLVGVLDQASPARCRTHAHGRQAVERRRRVRGRRSNASSPSTRWCSSSRWSTSPSTARSRACRPHDLIKEGYLHSKTMRWSAGGIRGRDGEWQWPASLLPMRGPRARRARNGVHRPHARPLRVPRRRARDELDELDTLLGAPIAESEHRLVALGPAAASTTPCSAT